MTTISIQKLREKAGLTQSELGERLQLSQAQVSRYEADPENVPYKVLESLLRALGTSLAEESAKAEPDASARIDPGQPYAQFERNLDLLNEYIGAAPPAVGAGKIPVKGAPTVEDLTTLIRSLKNKPNLVLMGPFDAGKSHLANSIMGVNHLPSDYQPATRLQTHIRHSETKPKWFPEDVWIMKGGFDPRRWADKKHCEQHRLVAGSYDTLRNYGTHGGRHSTNAEAYAALVFVDAPILRTCNIIDLPGFDDDEQDAKKANAVAPHIDILVYLSQANSFLKAPDLARLSFLIRNLPDYEKHCPVMPALGNLFVVATHASPSIRDDKLPSIPQKGSARLYEHLKDTVLKERKQATQRDISHATLEARTFTYWSESENRRKRFDQALTEALTTHMPVVWQTRFSQSLNAFKDSTKGFYANQIKAYERILADVRRAESDYTALKKQEPEFQKKVQRKRAEFERKLGNCRTKTRELLQQHCAWATDTKTLEKLIRSKYPNKEDAQSYAVGFVLETIQGSLFQECTNLSHELRHEMEDFVKLYDNLAFVLSDSTAKMPVQIPFDARGAFVGAVTGSLVIAVASIVGSLGLAIGLGALWVLARFALFGESWQGRLAKRIAKALTEQNFQAKFEQSLEQYWDQTQQHFHNSFAEVESRYEDYLNRLAEVIHNPNGSKADLQMLLEKLESARDFFGGLPWRPPTQ